MPKVDEGIFDVPPDLLHFNAMEQEQFSRSLAYENPQIKLLDHLQGLYRAAISNVVLKQEEEAIIYQLIGFTHYHLLFSTSCLLRCHLWEAFSSLRCAIDAALVGAHIIKDRSSQTAYINRTKPFDKLIRHYRNFLDRPDKLPHPHIPLLIEIHGTCSRFAGHADIDGFAHRIRFLREDNKTNWMTIEYFQFSRDDSEHRHHTLGLFHGFVLVLDVFSSFLVDEAKKVPEQWRHELHALGARIEKGRSECMLPSGYDWTVAPQLEMPLNPFREFRIFRADASPKGWVTSFRTVASAGGV